MDDSPDPSFAEFAAPPSRAIDVHRVRLIQERKDRRRRWLFLACASCGAAIGAGTGLGVSVGADVFPSAMGIGVVGAALGALAGCIVGAVTWAGLVFGAQAPGIFKSVGSEMVRGNSWDKLSAWVTVWGLIGILLGASAGSIKGTLLVRQGLVEAMMLPWSSTGATMGIAAAMVAWMFARRSGSRAGRSSEDEPQM